MASLTDQDLAALRFAVPAAESAVVETARFLPGRTAQRLLAADRIKLNDTVQNTIDAYAHLTRLRELAGYQPEGFAARNKRVEIAGSLMDLEGFLAGQGKHEQADRIRDLYLAEMKLIPVEDHQLMDECRQELYAELGVPDPLAAAA